MSQLNLKVDDTAIAAVNKQLMDVISNMQKIADSNYINLKLNSGNFNEGLKSANSNLESVTTNTRSFSGEIGNVIKRSAEWMAALIGIRSAIQEIQNGCSFITNLDTKLTDIAMITGKNKSSLQEYAKSWNQTAIDMKTTTNQVIDSNEEFMRAGKSIDESNKLTETNIKLARVSNEENGKMAEDLVKLSNAYGLSADGVDKYANKVAYLDSATAANSKDINSATIYAAQTAQSTGMSLDYLMAMITTVEEGSKKGAEAIGRSFKSIFLNMEKIQKTDTNAPMSDLEKTLNKQGIALRASQHEWRKSEDIIKDIMKAWSGMDGVTKSTITQYIAGKNQAEEFMAVMNKSARVQENYNNALGATNNLNDKYKEHLDSTQGSINELKATHEKFWMSMVNSSAINTAVKGLTSVVQTLQFLGTSAKGSAVAVVGLSTAFILLIKNFKNVNTVITTVFDAISVILPHLLLNLKDLGKLIGTGLVNALDALLTPAGAIIAIMALATVAIVKHIEHQKELKKETDDLSESYKTLTKAMQTNDVEQMKTSTDSIKKVTDELSNLEKQKKELEDKIKSTPSNTKNKNLVDLNLVDIKNQLDAVNTSIEEHKKELKDAGVSTEKLAQAQLQLKNNDIADKIKQEADAESKNKDMVKGLIQEYLQLNSIENKNSTQKERMSQLSQELSGYINGLKTTTDKYGNTTIQNTDLLGKEVTILNTEGNTVKTLANVKLTAAKNNAKAQVGETSITYQEISKRISMYSEESKAIADVYAQQGNLDTMMGENQKTISLATGKAVYADPLSGLIDQTKQERADEYKALTDAKSTLDSIYSTGSSSSTDYGNGGNGNDSNDSYMPPSGDDSKEKKSKKTKDTNDQTFEVEPLDEYGTSLKIIDSAFDSVNSHITDIQNKGKIFKDESDYTNELKNQSDLIDAMNSKLATTKDLQRQATNIRNIEVDKLQRSFGVANKIDASTLANMTEGDFDRLNPYKGMNITGLSEAQKKSYEDGQKLWESLTKNILDANSKVKSFGTEITNTEDDIYNATKDKQDTIETYLNNLYEKDLKPLDDKLKSLEENSKFIDSTDYTGKIANLNDELSTQQDILSKNQNEWSLLNSVFSQDGKITDDEQKKLDDLKTTITSTTDAVRELRKAQEDLAKEMIKSTLETNKTNEENALTDKTYYVSEKDWTKYRDDQIKAKQQAIDDIKHSGDTSVEASDAIKANTQDIATLQSQTYSGIKDWKTTFEDIHKANITALENEKTIEDQKTQDLQDQVDLAKLKTELDNAQENKNIQELQQNKDGSWDYNYVSDKDKVKDLTEQYNKKQEEIDKKFNDRRIEQDKAYEQQFIDDTNNKYDEQKQVIEDHYKDIDKLTKDTYKQFFDEFQGDMVKILQAVQDGLKSANTTSQLPSSAINMPNNSAEIGGKTYDMNTLNNGNLDKNTIADINKGLNDGSLTVYKDSNGTIRDIMTGQPIVDNANIPHLKTGGFTGDNEGMAYLDKNEIVLNSVDTSKIFATANIADSVTKMLGNIVPSFKMPDISGINNKNVSHPITNQFTIQHVDVADSTGFVDMLKDLSQNGIQFANNYKNRAYV